METGDKIVWEYRIPVITNAFLWYDIVKTYAIAYLLCVAFGKKGQGGVPNAYWICKPGIVLAPGRYTVGDSDPATWAQNGGSGGTGMTHIEGYVE